MGLFSFKQKPAPQTPLEAASYNDDDIDFSYTTQKGNNYNRNWGFYRRQLHGSFGITDMDDVFEMFAPDFTSRLQRMESMLKKLLVQNEHLQERCNTLEATLQKITDKSPSHTLSR